MVVDQSMPRVPVHDIVIQERENHLLVGTHGRSIFKLDIAPLQNLESNKNEGLYLYEIKSKRHRNGWGKKRRPYSEANIPELKITVYSDEERSAKLSVHLDGVQIQNKTVQLKKGISQITYDLTIDLSKQKKYEKKLSKLDEDKKKVKLEKADDGNIYLKSGSYEIKISGDGKTTTSKFKLK